MKFTSVRLTYKASVSTSVPLDSIIFPMDSTIDTSPFVIESIEGLDPPDIDILVADTLTAGGVFQNRSPQNREIVMTLGFQPNYAIGQTSETLRSQLYPFLAPKVGFPLSFSIRNGSTEIASTLCHIKRFEANIFSKDPQVQITLQCFDPYFTSPKYVVPSPGSIAQQPMTINNLGTAPTGFNIKLTLTSASTYVRISDSVSSLSFNYSFLSGDVVTIDTNVGSLSATVLRSSVTTNLLPSLSSAFPKWFPLHGGDNKIYVYGPTTWTLTNLEFYPRYWGV